MKCFCSFCAYGAYWKKFLSVLNYHAELVNHSKVSWMNIGFPVYSKPIAIYIKNNEIDPHNAHKSIRAHFIVISSHFLSWFFIIFIIGIIFCVTRMMSILHDSLDWTRMRQAWKLIFANYEEISFHGLIPTKKLWDKFYFFLCDFFNFNSSFKLHYIPRKNSLTRLATDIKIH